MKKWAFVLLFFMSVVLSGCDLLEQANLDDIEPDINLNDSVVGTLESGDEINYVFVVEENMEIVMYLESEFDSFAEISDSEGNMIALNDDFFGTDFYFNIPLSAGVYTITVSGYDRDDEGEFELFYEDNDSDIVLYTLEDGDFLSDEDVSQLDYGYYKLELHEETYLELVTYSNGPVDVYIFDIFDEAVSMGEYIASIDMNVLTTFLQEGTYYVYMEYDYTTTLVDVDYNERDHTLDYLTPENHVSTMFYEGAVNIIELTIEEADGYMLTMDSTNLDIAIYDEDFVFISFFDDSEEGEYLFNAFDEGTYYLVVSYGDANEIFTVDCQPLVLSEDVLAIGVETNGKLEAHEIADRYMFTIGSAGTYVIRINSTFDSYGTVYSTSMNLLDEDDDSNGNYDFQIEIYLNPGTYYLDVEGFDDDEFGTYTLHIDEITTVVVEDTALTVDSSYSGALLSNESYDSFVFNITTAGTYTIYVESDFDTYGFLLDSIHNIITFDDDSGEGVDFQIVEYLQPGTYHIKLEGYDASEYGSYTIFLKSGDQSSETSTQDDITFGIPVSGSVGYDEYVFYQFTLTETTSVQFSVISTFDSYGYITDSEYNVLTEDDDSNGDLDFLINYTLPAGTYYVVVCGYDPSDTGTYTLYPYN